MRLACLLDSRGESGCKIAWDVRGTSHAIASRRWCPRHLADATGGIERKHFVFATREHASYWLRSILNIMQVDNPPSITNDENNEQKSATKTIETQSGWRAVIDPWWKATQAILPIFIATRLLFVLLTYFGVVLFTVQ